MKETLYIEIPVEITFSIDPGQIQTHTNLGYPPSIEDIEFDNNQVIKEIEKAIYDKNSTVEEELMDAAINNTLDYKD